MARVSLAIGLWFVADLAVDILAIYLRPESVSTGALRSLMFGTLGSYIAVEWTEQLQLDVKFKWLHARLTGAAAGFAVGLVLGVHLFSTFLIDTLERLLAYYQ
jgi:hypothetical protein